MNEMELATIHQPPTTEPMNSNLNAFLRLIRWAEGTELAPDPYRVTYGYQHTLVDLSDHPAITGEWAGLRLADKYCRKAGLKPGCRSTAAGAYQIIKPTWVGLRKHSPKLLPDFSATSQDRAACLLLEDCKALAAIEKGEIRTAIERASGTWASLPGSKSGQPQKVLSQLIVRFSRFGGVVTD